MQINFAEPRRDMESSARCMEVQGMPLERKGDATCRVQDCATEERVVKSRRKKQGPSAKRVAANEIP